MIPRAGRFASPAKSRELKIHYCAIFKASCVKAIVEISMVSWSCPIRPAVSWQNDRAVNWKRRRKGYVKRKKKREKMATETTTVVSSFIDKRSCYAWSSWALVRLRYERVRIYFENCTLLFSRVFLFSCFFFFSSPKIEEVPPFVKFLFVHRWTVFTKTMSFVPGTENSVRSHRSFTSVHRFDRHWTRRVSLSLSTGFHSFVRWRSNEQISKTELHSLGST